MPVSNETARHVCDRAERALGEVEAFYTSARRAAEQVETDAPDALRIMVEGVEDAAREAAEALRCAWQRAERLRRNLTTANAHHARNV
jgi:hypothetical protein